MSRKSSQIVFIAKTITLCGRQELPFRDTSDHRNVLEEKTLMTVHFVHVLG